MPQRVPLGQLDGGMNEILPPSLLRENQFELLENFEYVNSSPFPETRRGSAWLGTFDDLVVNVFGFNRGALNGYAMVITTNNTPLTTFNGYIPGSGFTGEGTIANTTSDWSAADFDDMLILSTPTTGVAPRKWTGLADTAVLGGTPAYPWNDHVVWNNRVFAIHTTNPWTIIFSKLGNAEDWTDSDPVIGSGFFELLDGGSCRALAVIHERLIIFQDNAIHQVITANPNTDPQMWRLETITKSGGCGSKATIKTLFNDLIFKAYDASFGVCSLKTVMEFGDFEAASLSKDNILASNFGFAGAVGNQYIVGDTVSEYCSVLDFAGPQQARWSRFKFMRNTNGSVDTDVLTAMNSGFWVGSKQRLLYAFNNDADGDFQVCYWPNDGVGDDKYKDHLNGPDGVAKFRTIARSRAHSNGLCRQRDLIALGIAIHRKSTTLINEAGETGSTAKAALNIYYDENTSNIVTFNPKEATGSTVRAHNLWVHPVNDVGRHHNSFQWEFSTNESGVGVMLKDAEAEIAEVGPANSATLDVAVTA